MAFQQGLSGLNTSSKALDVTSNNIANASTVGFKSAVSHFADVYAASLTGTGASQIGIGASLSGIAQQYTQGNITTTSNSLDIAINGQGFYRLSQDGAIRYSRNGQFHLDAQGYVVNDKRENLTGYLADASGNIIPSTPTPILIDPTPISPRATGSTNIGVSYALNLDSSAQVPAVAWTSPTGVNAPQTNTYNFTDAVTIYDSLGNAHTMTMYFVKTATAGQWQVHFQVDGTSETNVPGSPLTLNFNSSGQLTNVPSPMPIAGFSVNLASVTADLTAADPTTPPNNAAPLSFNLDFTDSTQYGADFANSKKTQDGYGAGQLASMTVGQDGIVQGVYSNGQTRNLAQLVLANFRNPNGLLAIGNNDFLETADSGQPSWGAPKTGTLGVVQSGAVEDSNVDLTAELVNMIVQQRNYQANAQSIKTQDQIMQTLVNIR